MSGAFLWAYCRECGHRHALRDENFRQEYADWCVKHAKHSVGIAHGQVLLDDAEEWKRYKHNADVKIAYAASAAYTISLASLGSSGTWVAGRESTGISNATNKYLDYIIGGKITVGTGPTANTAIEVWAVGSVNDTPDYPDEFDGTDSAETVTSREILLASAYLLGVLTLPAAPGSDVDYWLRPTSLKYAMQAEVPPAAHSLFVTHNTGVALNATAGNHVLSYTPTYATVI